MAAFIPFTEGLSVSKDFHRVGKVLAVHLPGQNATLPAELQSTPDNNADGPPLITHTEKGGELVE